MKKSSNITQTIFVAILAFLVVFPYSNQVFALSSGNADAVSRGVVSGNGGNTGGSAASIMTPLPVSSFSANTAEAADPYSLGLSWLTPNQGMLSEFDLRYSDHQITENNFYMTTQLAGTPAPQAGAWQGFKVINLQPKTTYYFAIKTVNVVGEVSIAMFTSATTPGIGGGGINLPLPVSNFTGIPSINSAELSWLTPNQGMLSEFDLRYSDHQITENNFYMTTQLAGTPAPRAGQKQSFTATGLQTNTTYYFAIKTVNVVGEVSPAAFVSLRTGSNGGGSGGGGGGGFNNDSAYGSFTINNGEDCPVSVNVTLNITATNAANMMISNYSDFSGAAWQPFTDKKSWTLLPGTGKKTVYMKFRNSFNMPSSPISVSVCVPAGTVVTSSNNPQVIIVREFQPVRTIGGGQVLGTSIARVDFNDIMVNWGARGRNKADLNNDLIVDNNDVETLANDWVDIAINSEKAFLGTTLAMTPQKMGVVEGDTVSFVVMAKPQHQSERDYTAQIKIKYPTNLLEYKSVTYGEGWVPVIRPIYDESDVSAGIVTKTAGFAEGFSEPKMIGVVTFNVKKSGTGIITFGEDSFVLDREHQNSLVGMRMPKEVALTVFPLSGTSASFMANLWELFSGENSLGFILLIVFLAVLIGLYFLVKKNDGTENAGVSMSAKNEIFSVTS